jgi:acetyl esterase/lipase
LIRALSASAALQEAFSRAMDEKKGSPVFGRLRPIVWPELFFGIPFRPVAPRTLAYAEKEGGVLSLDFYPPAQAAVRNPGRAPCIVVVHGGGWDGGDRGQMAPLNAYLASAGYAVASIDYRLAPGQVYPAQIEDVFSALEFLRSHADGLGLDPARFALLGRSAGGQIALQAAYLSAGRAAVRGVVAFYAPADMVFGYSLPTSPLIMDSRKVMERYLGGSYPEHPGKYTASSPFEHVGKGSPPTLLLHGRPDVLVSFRHSEHLRARMDELGVRHFVVDLPWAAHGFDYVFRGPGSQISLYFIERFLEEAMR